MAPTDMFGRGKASRHLRRARIELDSAMDALTQPAAERIPDEEKADIIRRLKALEIQVSTYVSDRGRRA